ncbi:MAG TPA: DUF1611 domain-containing protein [Sphingomicrobium sp.]|nr:DUF1611 domain-containing protein [Sphingomicrobium sp.]
MSVASTSPLAAKASAAAAPAALALPTPYLLFLGDVTEPGYAKTAFGLRDWAADNCIGEYVSDEKAVTTDLPRMTPAQAAANGARAMIIAVANSGGYIPESWYPALLEALAAGLDLVAGMHVRLAAVPGLAEAAREHGRRLIDVRKPPENIPVGTGIKRSGKRLLTVGTDCALGKKYTALALTNAFERRGLDVDFRATGQTGIMIAGGGIPMDAVVSDFLSGAAELLSPDAAPGHWDVIEGQGSLLHPAYSAVSTGLLLGSQPDVFVVCHDPTRHRVLGHRDFVLPTIEEIISLTMELGRRTNPSIRCGGIAYNTGALKPVEAERLMELDSDRLGLQVADPIRRGPAFERLVASCLEA